jgi:hypothetical protein
MKSTSSGTSAGPAHKLTYRPSSLPELASFKLNSKEFSNLNTHPKPVREKQASTESVPVVKIAPPFITSTMIKSTNQEIWLFMTWEENGMATVLIKQSLSLSVANSLKNKNKSTTLSTKPKDKS